MASFAPEPIIHIGKIVIPNTFLATLLVDFIIVSAAITISKKIKLIPSMFQNIVESVIEAFYNLTESIAANRTAKIFPYFMTFFLFILVANWSSLIPGFGTIGFFEEHEHERELIPILRGATSDLNVTLALALISAFATHMLSIKTIGIKDYLSRYFSFNPINLFIGILEIISEITKVISLSFRLFGNIFAGEVVLLTTSSIFAFIFPVPFLLLEVIVGLVQALVFGMLTMTFMAVLSTPHHEPAVTKGGE
ncbi:MAG: ATP synthase F0 subunit A [Candidatus Levybacteria bacterium RIFCSPLOWO2_01_FULL_37_26]|nr:MAG: ATP synthase F0 subunit A [Candidatus Levybacteria bacterium RIFCSPHIGHO2_12_FULL_37_9]OGH37478.1 MAG: ATP synthase F0 subunit A [Candidatus Levybacteria bacterium RIFCSPLOWO2_01_FULL_37_26]